MDIEQYQADLKDARVKLDELKKADGSAASVFSLKRTVTGILEVLDLILGKDEGK